MKKQLRTINHTGWILLVLLLASCTATTQNTTPQQVVQEPSAPSPVIITNATHDQNESANKAAPVANDTGYKEWEEWYAASAATLLVTDGRKAARMYLPQGKTVELPMRTPVTLTINAIGHDGNVHFSINDEQATLAAREDAAFLNDTIRVFIQDVIVKD